MTERVIAAPRAIFLDFDGVVCDTERAARRSWEELYALSGLRLSNEVWSRMMGSSAGADVARQDLAARRGVDVSPQELLRRQSRKRELADQEPLRPGVADLVAHAVRAGVPVAVVSSSPARWVEPHLARLGLLALLSFMVTGEEAQHHKPAPDLYLLALDRARTPAGTTLAVEDSLPGVIAAKRAGLWCVAVPNQTASLPADCGADAVLTSLELLELVWANDVGRKEGIRP